MAADPVVPEGFQIDDLSTIPEGFEIDQSRISSVELPKEDERSFGEQFLSALASPETSIAAGATAGAAAGAPLGPLGVLAGGGLGAAGGLVLNEDVRQALSLLSGESPEPIDPADQLRRAGEEALLDVGFSAGSAAAGPLLKRAGKPLLGKALGVKNEASRRITDLSQSLGVDIGTINVSPRKFIRGSATVLGVFPFVGTPLRQSQKRLVGQLDAASADLLNTLAPVTTTFDVSKRLGAAAQKRFAKFNKISSVLFERFNKLADNLPIQDIVPSAPIKSSLKGINLRQAPEAITLTTGESLQQFGDDTIGAFLNQLSDLPEKITVRQARGLERTLNEAIGRAVKEGFDVSRLRTIKRGLETAKANLDVSELPPELGEEVLNAWQRANAFFSDTASVFETATAKKLGRVDKNVFNRGVFKSGTRSQDEIFGQVFQAKSPDSLKDLRNLVGPQEFKRASSKFLSQAYQASIKAGKEGALVGDVFSAADFEKRLGLGTKEGDAALKEMLRGSNVTTKDFRNFLEVAKRATDVVIRDPSTFLTRRIVLGGGLAGGALLGASAGSSGGASIPVALLLTVAARKGSRFLTNPEQLKLMTRVLDDTVTDQVRRGAAVRIIRLLDREEDNAN